MLYHIFFGLIVPLGLAGIYLTVNFPRITVLFFPIGAATAFLLNDWGFTLFYQVTPPTDIPLLAVLPYQLGLYPVLACMFISVIHIQNLHFLIPLVSFVSGTTLLEYVGVLSGTVIYTNDWTIFWSALSYLAAYVIIFLYYQLVIKMNLLNPYEGN